MTTYPSLEAATEAAGTTHKDRMIRCILEIEHATEGRRYICCVTSMDHLAKALRSKPMPAIKRLVREYPYELPDTRSQAEQDYDAVELAYDKAERLDARGGVSSTIQARMQADRLYREWAAKYPAEAQARQDAAEAREASRQAEIASRPGYKAALEGRD